MIKFTVGQKVEHARYRWGVGEVVGVVANKYLSCMEVRYVVQFERFAHTLWAADLKRADLADAPQPSTPARSGFVPRVVDGPQVA